jgi:hypothetical protein
MTSVLTRSHAGKSVGSVSGMVVLVTSLSRESAETQRTSPGSSSRCTSTSWHELRMRVSAKSSETFLTRTLPQSTVTVVKERSLD